MTNPGVRPSTLVLTCLDGDSCLVRFEPWGSEHVLDKSNAFFVQTEALETGNVEVSFVSDGIVVGISSDAKVTVRDRFDRELAV